MPSREKFAAIVLEATLLIIIVCRCEMKTAERYGTFILPVVLHIDLPVRLSSIEVFEFEIHVYFQLY